MSNKHKVIVISGCTKGIGRAIADYFAHEGFNVAGYARNKEDIQLMEREYIAQYPNQRFLLMTADASLKADIIRFTDQVKSSFEEIEVLVNNAGQFTPGSIFTEEEGVLENLMQVNVYSAYHLTRSLKGRLKRNIFNICSIASLQAYPAGASYTITKFALLGFSKQLREELKAEGIKVTSIMPGAVNTDAWSGSNLPSSRFISSTDIGKIIYSTYELSEGADIEELVIRPQLGDI